MKKLRLLLCILLAVVCASAVVVFAACEDKTPDNDPPKTEQDGMDASDKKKEEEKKEENKEEEEETKLDISGVTLSPATVTYDGQPHRLEVAGTVPEDVEVTYENNNQVDAGKYTVKATLSGEKYNTLTLTATLTIEKADITGITFSDDTVTYNGQARSLEIKGELPAGVSVVYENNGQTEAGSYTVKAILTGKNYNTLELEATLRILPNLSGLAQSIMDSFGSTPDVWEFLPPSFRLNEDRAYTGPQTIDFTTAKSVSEIPTTGIGKQLDVIYGTVVNMQELLGYVNTFYKAANSIGTLYQEYINANPDNYSNFEGQTDGGAIGFKIELADTQYKLLAKISSASLEITSDTEGGYTGRIQITDSNALKFEVGEDTLTIALNILNHAVTQLIFVRTANAVTCHMYETLYFGDKTLMETSALLTWADNVVSVCGANGDFFLGSSGEVVELYDATTGAYLGSKVKETVSVPIVGDVIFNTYWFNLANIGGLNNVRYDGDKFYVNGSEFNNKKVATGIFDTNPKRESRRYDIEMKKTYYYVYDGKNFEKIEIEIPMIFVQEENYGTFASDIMGENSGLAIVNNVPASTKTWLDVYYISGLEAYEAIADLITPQAIADYVGVKDEWFERQLKIV